MLSARDHWAQSRKRTFPPRILPLCGHLGDQMRRLHRWVSDLHLHTSYGLPFHNPVREELLTIHQVA